MMTLEKFAEAVSSEVAKRLGAGFHVLKKSKTKSCVNW